MIYNRAVHILRFKRSHLYCSSQMQIKKWTLLSISVRLSCNLVPPGPLVLAGAQEQGSG